MVKTIYEELSYKFRNLPSLQPDRVKQSINIFDNLLNDDFVYSVSPERYTFYLEFMKALQDPEVLKEVIYETKLIKKDKDIEQKIVEKIVTNLSKLYVLPTERYRSDSEYIAAKKNLKNEEFKIVSDKINRSVQLLNDDNNDIDNKNIQKVINETFPSTGISPNTVQIGGTNDGNTGSTKNVTWSGEQDQQQNQDQQDQSQNQGEYQQDQPQNQGEYQQDPPQIQDQQQYQQDPYGIQYQNAIPSAPSYSAVNMQQQGFMQPVPDNNAEDKKKEYIKENKLKAKGKYNELKRNFKEKSTLFKYAEKLNTELDKNHDNNKLKALKIKDVIEEMESNDITSFKRLTLSKEDKLVFIGITFLLRLLVIALINWSLNTNFITTFTHAFILYITFYTIIILLIVVIVNLTYNLPVVDLYRGKHGVFSTLASSLYYFYLIPGNEMTDSIRLIVHIGLMVFIVFIAILLKEKDNDNDAVLNYDYTIKKNIKRVISDFTMLIWLFTSIIAMYMF